MSNTDDTTRRDRVLVTALKNGRLADKLPELHAEEQAAPSLLATLKAVQGEMVDRALTPDWIAAVQDECGPTLTELAVLILVTWHEVSFSQERLGRLWDSALSALPADSVAWLHLRVRQGVQAILEGDSETAESRVTEARRLARDTQPQYVTELSAPFIDYAEGLLARAHGNYQLAHRLLEQARLDSVANGLLLAPVAIQEWANFLWECGLPNEALQVHVDPDSRTLIEATSTDLLVRSHLSAAKCAIDLQDLPFADRELRAAEQLIRESEEISDLSKGYYALRYGEYLLAMGVDDLRGSNLIEEACALFQQMDPPCHPGLLDGKIVLTRYAIKLEDHARLLKVIHLLLEEAEEHGCLEARARLLVLESAMWVSENPPLEEGFENLALRVNLINNPALMMQACANLYIYSLRYLDKPSQAFMMARLRRLQEVLEHSCYQDLYEKYIESRYCWAVEGRLAEFLEEEQSLFEERVDDHDEDEEDDYDHDDDLESTL